MTYLEAAQWAIDCQDACNLSGVVHSFDKAMSAIWDEAHKTGKGTQWVNEHPIVTLYLSKLSDLNRKDWLEHDYYKAHEAVKSILSQDQNSEVA